MGRLFQETEGEGGFGMYYSNPGIDVDDRYYIHWKGLRNLGFYWGIVEDDSGGCGAS